MAKRTLVFMLSSTIFMTQALADEWVKHGQPSPSPVSHMAAPCGVPGHHNAPNNAPGHGAPSSGDAGSNKGSSGNGS